MSVELRSRLHAAAARPSGDAPLPAIEARLRTRRRRRLGAVVVGGVTAVALVATVSIAVLTGDGGPTVRTTDPAQSTTAAYGLGFTVDLPPGWVETRYSVDVVQPVLFVGTEVVSRGSVPCPSDPAGAIWVISQRATWTPRPNPEGRDPQPAPMSRPADFTVAEPFAVSTCTATTNGTESELSEYAFIDDGQIYEASLALGSEASDERRAEAFAVINSLRTELDVIEPPTVPTSDPPITVPASADTAAIEAVFARWLSTKPPEFAGGAEMVEDFDALVETLRAAAADVGNPQAYSGQVDAVTSIDGDRAEVVYSLLANGQPAYPGMRGSAVRIDGVWKVSRETICDYVAIGRIRCPAV